MTTPIPNTPQSHRDTLQDLIDMGADIARMLHRKAQSEAGTPTGPTPETTIAFDRIARTVRRTILLVQHLDHPPRPERDPADGRAAARRHVIRAVEDTIQRTTRGAHHAESIHAELLDRLDSPEFEDDLQGRPIAALIAEICRDLGLDPVPPGVTPWKRRTPADIAILHARAATPSRAAPGRPRPSQTDPPPQASVHPIRPHKR